MPHQFRVTVCSGLKHTHSAGILHRDLKPSNVAVNMNCDIKIIDYGLARDQKDLEGDPRPEYYIVTRPYRAPELLCGERDYDGKVDMWSVGCILGELLGRKPLFRGRNSQRSFAVLPCASFLF